MRQLVLVAAICVSSLSLQANNVHLKGKFVSFTDLGLALQAAGALAGLGNGDVLVSMSATADVVSTCTNQGGNQAPGQNPAPITVSGSQAIPEEELKNGNTPFNVQTVPPPAVIAGAPDCPNPNWTERIEDLLFTSATITVDQPVGTQVFTLACTFSPATTNGAVPNSTVSCQ